jgi:hypothetical protein
MAAIYCVLAIPPLVVTVGVVSFYIFKRLRDYAQTDFRLGMVIRDDLSAVNAAGLAPTGNPYTGCVATSPKYVPVYGGVTGYAAVTHDTAVKCDIW